MFCSLAGQSLSITGLILFHFHDAKCLYKNPPLRLLISPTKPQAVFCQTKQITPSYQLLKLPPKPIAVDVIRLIYAYFCLCCLLNCLNMLLVLIKLRHQYFHNIFITAMSSPSQLFSSVQAVVILQSPLNNSTAKNHYTFARDSRFKRPKYYCDSFYQIPGVKQNRSRMAGVGYGRKTDLQCGKDRHNVTPSPDAYQISGFVESNRKSQKGFTPLKSREEVAPMSYIELEPTKVPGPGRYNEYRRNQSPKWSLHRRVSAELFPSTTAKIVPGPGAYNNQQALEHHRTGQFHLSNHRSSKSKVFNPPRSTRFYKSTTDVPGPGIYQPQNQLPNDGKYVLSRNVSAGKRTFMGGRRTSFTQLEARRSFTPGPGSYRSPSQFGQYDAQRDMRASSSSSTGERLGKTARTKMSD